MKLHERVTITQRAGLELNQFTLALAEKYELTYGELTMLLADRLACFSKYQIRSERHPEDPERPGGLE